jgi:hypothetical protein
MLSGKHKEVNMPTGKDIPSAEQSQKHILARREAAVEQLELARKSGNRKEIAAYQSLVKKFDELISKYGLDPNA